MTKSDAILVQVPATTANLGAGFDCLGAALSLENEFQFRLSDTETSLAVEGSDAQAISLDEDNLLYKSFLSFYQTLGTTAPAVDITIKINVPLARGLGSSATAIIAGLLAANYYSQDQLTQTELLNLAIAIEGHPDNVVPAMLGNCILSVGEKDNWHFVPIICHHEVEFIVAVPNFKLSTEEARSVLPANLSYGDAVFNMAHLSLLIKGLETGNPEWLQEALQDRIHQPYRQSLIKGYEQVYDGVLQAGGYGMVISGAGPSLLALSHPSRTEAVVQAMENIWRSLEVKPMVKCLNLQTQGATIITQ